MTPCARPSQPTNLIPQETPPEAMSDLKLVHSFKGLIFPSLKNNNFAYISYLGSRRLLIVRLRTQQQTASSALADVKCSENRNHVAYSTQLCSGPRYLRFQPRPLPHLPALLGSESSSLRKPFPHTRRLTVCKTYASHARLNFVRDFEPLPPHFRGEYSPPHIPQR
jgi:hypothetical protein